MVELRLARIGGLGRRARRAVPDRVGVRPARLAGLVTAIVLVSAAQAAPAHAGDGTIRGEGSPKAIANSYVVVLDDAELNKSQPDTVIDFLAREHQAKINYRYLNAFRGFAASMSRAQALRMSLNP